jgi:hypothetical protein
VASATPADYGETPLSERESGAPVQNDRCFCDHEHQIGDGDGRRGAGGRQFNTRYYRDNKWSQHQTNKRRYRHPTFSIIRRRSEDGVAKRLSRV